MNLASFMIAVAKVLYSLVLILAIVAAYKLITFIFATCIAGLVGVLYAFTI